MTLELDLDRVDPPGPLSPIELEPGGAGRRPFVAVATWATRNVRDVVVVCIALAVTLEPLAGIGEHAVRLFVAVAALAVGLSLGRRL